MRPKHQILLYCQSDIELSLTRYLLETWGYAVHGVDTPARAKELMRLNPPDYFRACLAIHSEKQDYAAGVIKSADKRKMPTLFVNLITGPPIEVTSSAALYPPANTPADILEALKTIAAKKRGPKGQPTITHAHMVDGDYAERRTA